ncbi:hypothetical protein [Lactobacillus xylocopicola]|uniref:Uncharacterized protein n=1 Tax=Lactobacillus xylocopicola TaxID=2976676 RepID=A0ABM8BEZ7_9LACO|nr:hypothetical protein [Lactobacillus xylocopicola]BDR59772.1 hypothetical protein KIM322_00330 [Lactobacillus xylocopicola]
MTKNRKRKLKYYAETVFFMILTAGKVFRISQHLLKHLGWEYIVKDLVWLVLCLVVTVGTYYNAKDVGTSEDLDADERYKYLNMKTDQQVLKIINVLLFVLGYGFLMWSVILYQQVGQAELKFILLVIGIVLVTLWNLLIIAEIVLFFVNDYRN